jgi:hypothetical protein
MGSSPNFAVGQIPSVSDWDSYFASKVDQTNGTLTNPTINNPTFGGPVTWSGPQSFSGALTASGGGTFTGTFAGSPTWSGLHTFSGTGTALAVTHNATVGGTLGVTGAATFSAALAAAAGGSVAGTFTGTPTWSGLHTFSGGLTVSANPLKVGGQIQPATANTNVIINPGTASVLVGSSGTGALTAGTLKLGRFGLVTSNAQAVDSAFSMGGTLATAGAQSTRQWQVLSDTMTRTGGMMWDDTYLHLFGDTILAQGVGSITSTTLTLTSVVSTGGLAFAIGQTLAGVDSAGVGVPDGTTITGGSGLSWTISTPLTMAAGTTFYATIPTFAGGRGNHLLACDQAGPVQFANAVNINPIQISGSLHYPMGGTDLGDNARGTAICANPYWLLSSGAKNMSGGGGIEVDIEAQAGSSYRNVTGLFIAHTGNHAVSGAANRDLGITIADVVGATNTAGWDAALGVNARYGQFPIKPTGSVIRIDLGEQYATVPSSLAWGDDYLIGTFSGGPIRYPGGGIDGSGNLRAGTGFLNVTSTGIAVDASGQIATAVALVSGGSGWGPHSAASYATDANGGVYTLTIVAGVVTAVAMYRAPFIKSGSTPTNPVTLTPDGQTAACGATGLTVSLTWDSTRTARFEPQWRGREVRNRQSRLFRHNARRKAHDHRRKSQQRGFGQPADRAGKLWAARRQHDLMP